jgi:ribosomal protein S6
LTWLNYMCRHSFYMSNIYETTIIVKPDLANDQMKNLNTSIEQFFSDNEISIGYKEDWGIKNLKFSINKYSKGSFKFIRFDANTEFPKKLDSFLKFNTDCLRFLITKSNDNIDQATPQINKDN